MFLQCYSCIVLLLKFSLKKSNHTLHSSRRVLLIENTDCYQNNGINVSVLQEVDRIKNAVVLVFPHIQCSHLMYSKKSWILVFSGTPIRPQVILNLDYLPDHLSFYYDCFFSISANCTVNKKQ